jgi:hypothetical protein
MFATALKFDLYNWDIVQPEFQDKDGNSKEE